MRSTATRPYAPWASPVAQGLIEHHETIDVIGEVTLWVRDLEAAWKQEDAQVRTEVTRGDACVTLEFDIAAPRQTVWEYLTVPGQWQKWWDADDIVESSSKGRRGVGTENHCKHGKGTNIEETLDWRPVDYFTVSIALPVPGAPRIVMTRALLEGPNGTTHFELRVVKPKPKDKAFVEGAAAKFDATHEQGDGWHAIHGRGGPTCRRRSGRAAAEAIDRTLPDRGGEIGRVALKPSYRTRSGRRRTRFGGRTAFDRRGSSCWILIRYGGAR